MDGYILNAREPFCVPVDERVRWQGQFEDGTGMIAFSGLGADPARWLAAIAGGTLAIQEPIPEYPPSWPFPAPHPAGLKHKRCLADTIIVRYLGFSPAVYDALAADPRVQGASWTDRGLLLVEVGSDDIPVSLDGLPKPIGSDVLVDCRDVRVERVPA